MVCITKNAGSKLKLKKKKPSQTMPQNDAKRSAREKEQETKKKSS
jgi:hypothetical protein